MYVCVRISGFLFWSTFFSREACVNQSVAPPQNHNLQKIRALFLWFVVSHTFFFLSFSTLFFFSLNTSHHITSQWSSNKQLLISSPSSTSVSTWPTQMPPRPLPRPSVYVHCVCCAFLMNYSTFQIRVFVVLWSYHASWDPSPTCYVEDRCSRLPLFSVSWTFRHRMLSATTVP